MSNINVSLKNYETLIWLFKIEESDTEWKFQNAGCQMLIALIARRNDKISDLCYVLADVLHNPCNASSHRATRLVALNGDINRTARPSPPQSFSGDATQELDKDQIFNLFYSYLRLRHAVSQKRLFSDAALLENLLAGIDNEFRAYFEISKEHKNLLWNGFKNGARNIKKSLKPSRRKTLTYADFRHKIEEYYFSAPPDTFTPPVIQGNPDDYEETPYEGRAIPEGEPNWDFCWRYFPIFFAYLSYIGYVLFLPPGILWRIVFGVATFAASIIWGNLFRRKDRAWATLLQGLWLLFYFIVPRVPDTGVFIFILVCLLLVFNQLPRRYTDTPKKLKQFIHKGIAVLLCIGFVAVMVQNEKASQAGRNDTSWREPANAINRARPKSFRFDQESRNTSTTQRTVAKPTTISPPKTIKENANKENANSLPKDLKDYRDNFVKGVLARSEDRKSQNEQPYRVAFADTLKNLPKDSPELIRSTIQTKLNQGHPSLKIIALRLLSEDATAPSTYRAEITYNQALYGASNAWSIWFDKITGDKVEVVQGQWREVCLITPAGAPTPYRINWTSPSQWSIEPIQRAENYIFESRLAHECANEALFLEGSEATNELHNLLNQALALSKQIKRDNQDTSFNIFARKPDRESTQRLDAFSRDLGTFFRINRGKIVGNIPSHLFEILQGRRICPKNCPFWETYIRAEEIREAEERFKRNPTSGNMLKTHDLIMKRLAEEEYKRLQKFSR